MSTSRLPLFVHNVEARARNAMHYAFKPITTQGTVFNCHCTGVAHGWSPTASESGMLSAKVSKSEISTVCLFGYFCKTKRPSPVQIRHMLAKDYTIIDILLFLHITF